MSDTSDDQGDDELVYELGDWTAEERTDLEGRLAGSGVGYRWEEDEDLVVAAGDEQVVEALLDEVEFPNQMEAVDETAADVDDEAVYAVMSDLYVAADRLKDDPSDGNLATDFASAADEAVAAPPPFGVAPEVWHQVQELASGITDALAASADDDVVARDAGDLRHLLSRFV